VGFLAGIRVLEIADELGEYCGKLFAGLGADVVKVEPADGEVTRTYGPFLEDIAGADRSLHFWHYNAGKRSVSLDLDKSAGRRALTELATVADVLIDSRPRGYLDERGIGFEQLKAVNPLLVFGRISAFGDDGPWADLAGSDLVHLALGGVAMNCGYDPRPDGTYDTPPVAPQVWQSYHLAGEHLAMGIITALYDRDNTSRGQRVAVNVHQVVSAQTETDVPNWLYNRIVNLRATCRPSRAGIDPPQITMTKDGRWIRPWLYSPNLTVQDLVKSVGVLKKYGMEADLEDPKYQDAAYLARKEVLEHIRLVFEGLSRRLRYDHELWREFQAAGVGWAALRLPGENIDDEHWRSRGSYVDVEHVELSRTFTEVGARWVCEQVPWVYPQSAPTMEQRLNADDVLEGWLPRPAGETERRGGAVGNPRPRRALEGVRFLDLTWLLASGGAGRYLAAHGAEVIKVEHMSHPDFIRYPAMVGSRRVKSDIDGAAQWEEVPLETDPANPNRRGFFLDVNAGKRGISLDFKHPEGRSILRRLIEISDIVAEGFTPNTMQRLGFGYDELRKINPRIVYVQQSGMGNAGTYGDMRSTGPIAQALSGLSEMSGLPSPYPPAGIGYSFLDWFGAYNVTTAIMAGLYRQRVTGEGCWIDCSQVEVGAYLTGACVLDYSANGRHWQRTGNRSPYKPAAPHGIYPCRGDDRWIAIACFTQQDWMALTTVLGDPEWALNAEFATPALRLRHQDALDDLVGAATRSAEPFALMDALQAAGVPAGVCQTAADRCLDDPQLQHLGWLRDLPQTEIGTWPVKEIPISFERTAAEVGGTLQRSGPSYGEDNEYIYGELLGLSSREIEQLRDDHVI
jgi:crotonobetainyl-CoA:carnitine CoA-transferase CaiB-like acyl-CoA transferase